MQEEEKENEREREEQRQHFFFNSSYFSFRRLLRAATQLSLSPKKKVYKKISMWTVKWEWRIHHIECSWHWVKFFGEASIYVFIIFLSLFSLFSIVLAFWWMSVECHKRFLKAFVVQQFFSFSLSLGSMILYALGWSLQAAGAELQSLVEPIEHQCWTVAHWVGLCRRNINSSWRGCPCTQMIRRWLERREGRERGEIM